MTSATGKPKSESSAARTAVLISSKLRMRRQESGLSVANLAMISGISISKIRRMEKGSGTPTMLVCLKLANALEANLADIIREAEEVS
jgi:transcriptional regulator with XRE-family HTH domain